MKRVVFQCAGAPVPPRLTRGDEVSLTSVSHLGGNADVFMRIQSPESALLATMDSRGKDLLLVACYAYVAEQTVSRGGDTDVYGDSWYRDLTLCVPVSDPDFWNDPGVLGQLKAVLNFASGDSWDFHFTKGRPEDHQLPIEFDPQEALQNPDSLFLFSGGMDSLCAVVEARLAGKKPLLVGHSPAFHIRDRQRRLANSLKNAIGGSWHFPLINVAVHKTRYEARETTQRTRGFLFAAMGLLFADRLGIERVAIADNGVVSLNLPINHQLVDTKASRSTHPRFLRLFNNLADSVLTNGSQVFNPLWDRTRAETLESLKRANATALLEETNSCSHTRFLTQFEPHCGICSQCIDRRFATLIAGLEEYDPSGRYKVDIFRHDLPEGKDRTMAASYYRFATTVASLTEEGLFERFPQLYECVDPGDRDAPATAQALVDLLHRHGSAVTAAMQEQIHQAESELARQTLPPYSLVRMAAGPTGGLSFGSQPSGDSEVFRHSPDYRRVWLRDELFSLSTN